MYKISILISFFIAVPCFSTSLIASEKELIGSIQTVVQPERGLLEWRFNGRRILVYAFGKDQIKPYVRELYTLEGDNVLRDSPEDHSHHHGMMLAFWVNDINFWEETGQPGYELHVKLLHRNESKTSAGLARASFTELIHWTAHENRLLEDAAKALLIERRTLALTVDASKGETALEWRSDFEVGDGAKEARIHGSNYNGLGLRLPAALNQTAVHENSEGSKTLNRAEAAVEAARWSALKLNRNGGGPQIALCVQPDVNAGAEKFFTMTRPFAYLSATQDLDVSPRTYRQGEAFSLRHLVLVYSKARTAKQIEERYQRWIRQSR